MEDPTRHPNENGINENGTKNLGDEMKGLVGKVVVAGNDQGNRKSFEKRHCRARAAADIFDDSSSDDEAVVGVLLLVISWNVTGTLSGKDMLHP